MPRPFSLTAAPLALALLLLLAVAGCTVKSSTPPTSGARLEYTISLEFALERDPGPAGMLAAAEELIRKRVSSIAPAFIGTEEPNRIIVDLPDVPAEKIAAVKQLLSRSGTMTFAIVDTDATAELIETVRAAGGETSTHRLVVDRESGEELLLLREGALSDVTLDTAHSTVDSTGAPAIGFSLWSQADEFGELTAQNIGRQLAIATGGKVIQSARINARIDANGIIEGSYTAAEVDAIVTALGIPFAVPPTLVSETTYGVEVLVIRDD